MNLLEPVTFYFDLPLYTPIKITSENNSDFWDILSSTETIHGYNPDLKENSTYKVYPSRTNGAEHLYTYGGVSQTTLLCLRTKEEFYVYVHYDKEKEKFQKIGQYPSIASFHISQIRKYDKVLNKEKLKEFTRAIGLAANGVGIGSYVYLRRIFEELIEEAHIKAKNDNGWNDDIYLKQRMSERIELLKNHLPTFLVENKSLYGILSVGIHSLKEEDCLTYFETVKVGIELILDEKVEQYNKLKKIEEAKEKLSELTKKIQKG